MSSIVERIGNFVDRQLQMMLTPKDQRHLVSRDFVRQQLEGSDERPTEEIGEFFVPSLSADPADAPIGISLAAARQKPPEKTK